MKSLQDLEIFSPTQHIGASACRRKHEKQERSVTYWPQGCIPQCPETVVVDDKILTDVLVLCFLKNNMFDIEGYEHQKAVS